MPSSNQYRPLFNERAIESTDNSLDDWSVHGRGVEVEWVAGERRRRRLLPGELVSSTHRSSRRRSRSAASGHRRRYRSVVALQPCAVTSVISATPATVARPHVLQLTA